VQDPNLQLELNRYNLEYNFNPVQVIPTPFTEMETDMVSMLHRVDAVAQQFDSKVVPIGILPTLTERDVTRSVMSDSARYRALSAGLRNKRNGEFEINIDGKEPLKTKTSDINFEGANTSLQVHLRVSPR